ncbi:hypothetical protein ABW20_dc0103389 [Dactylellina cionopaga]|nr:hypothetical protein ABW20_dc0103389 [Dactylellina cionopaga]
MSSPRRRIETDVMKLMSDYEVTLVNDNSMGPTLCMLQSPELTCPAGNSPQNATIGKNSMFDLMDRKRVPPFEGGIWKVHVELPDQYPYKSPSIGFVNKIFHPNIDELSGSVCLDVINQTWSPMFDMINIFEVFLPQLLGYPNANDPLNGEAAALMMRNKDQYSAKVKEYVNKYATKEAIDAAEDESESDEEMSSVGSYDSGDEDPAGTMEV